MLCILVSSIKSRAVDFTSLPPCPVMMLAQCFAIMPLTGIWQPNPRRTYFRFKSPQMIVTLIFMATSSILSLGMLKHLLKIGITARNMGEWMPYQV